MRYCIFTGSRPGNRAEYTEAARELGRLMATSGIGLVYGGASVGLMGAVADAALSAGGEVIGVIPQFLVDREVAHRGLDDLRITASMHERKQLMADLSNGFIALPGGVGTLEEIFEVWTWRQLGRHQNPCALLNVQGFYDGLVGFLGSVAADGFMAADYRRTLLVEESPEALLRAMQEA